MTTSRQMFADGITCAVVQPDIYFDERCESVDTTEREKLGAFARMMSEIAQRPEYMQIVAAVLERDGTAADMARRQGVSRKTIHMRLHRIMARWPMFAQVMECGRYQGGWIMERRAPHRRKVENGCATVS